MSHHTLGATLLVAGTAIGAGMLALPLTTGQAGFFPSSLMLVAIFAYMLMALFALLEANLYLDDPSANIISMAKQLLGPWAERIAWFCFLMLLYAASAAYISAGGNAILSATHAFHTPISHPQSELLFIAFFGGLAYFGIRWVDQLNRWLMLGLGLTYLVLVISVAPHVEWTNLQTVQPHHLWGAVPIMALSFTSHIVLPSLRSYLGDHLPSLKRALVYGSLIPLVFYLIWEGLLLGILPTHSVQHIADAAQPLVALDQSLHSLGLHWIGYNNQWFSFFAIVTSFLGVAISLADFLADGLKLPNNRLKRLWLMVFTILPPALFALHFPKAFTLALNEAGVFVAVLYGILPACMLWKARYNDRRPTPAYTLPGGRITVMLCGLGGVGIILFQTVPQLMALK